MEYFFLDKYCSHIDKFAGITCMSPWICNNSDYLNFVNCVKQSFKPIYILTDYFYRTGLKMENKTARKWHSIMDIISVNWMPESIWTSILLIRGINDTLKFCMPLLIPYIVTLFLKTVDDARENSVSYQLTRIGNNSLLQQMGK